MKKKFKDYHIMIISDLAAVIKQNKLQKKIIYKFFLVKIMVKIF